MAKNNKVYRPSQEILKKYANVLVSFALGSGNGIKKGETVYIAIDEIAKPFFIELRRAIWKAGGHVISGYRPSNDFDFNVDKDFFLYAKNHQINFFPAKYMKGLIDEIDHSIFIISDTDKRSLLGVDSKKIMERNKMHKPFMDWRNEKENAGKFTWTLGLYGTEAMAKEASMNLKDYWGQIINACFLNERNPIKKWKEVYKKLESYRQKLNRMPIEKLHIKGADVDLWIGLGKKRKWMGGSGRNIPSFELFTSPDWYGTNGWINFNQPLYRYGSIIKGIKLTFKNGKVVSAKASSNEKLLKQMIATENADKVGEFSMTDRRFSNITKFMAETLFDENIGGRHGNTHIALGNAYHDCLAGDPGKLSKSDWKKLGFNDSSIHTDIISTTDRTITAHLQNGSKKIIYHNGEYVF